MADPVLVLNVSDHPVHVAGVDINPGVAAWVDPTGGDVQASILAGVLALNPNLSKADPVTFPGWPLGVELPGGTVPVGPAADLVAVEARARLAGDQDLRQRLDGLVAGTVDLGAVYAAITAEAGARADADAELDADLAEETAARAAAITAAAATAAAATATLAATVASRSTALTNEVEARTAGEATLTGLLNTERTQRSAADQALADTIAGIGVDLQAQFDSFVGGVDVSAVNTEATQRADADTALGARIDAEAAARASADNTLGARIDTEAANRAAAVTAEANARASAITAEQAARVAGIAAEATARDTAIAAAVAAVEGGAGGAVTTLTDLAALLADSGDAVASLVTQYTTLSGVVATKETPAGAQTKVDVETAARVAAISALAATVAAETTARGTAITTEAAARAAGDSALDARTTTLETGLAAELTARAAAVTGEATTRATADTNEANARIAADTAEASARASAVTAEATARSAAIATAIAAEVASRVAGDATTLDNATAYVDGLDGIRGAQIAQEITDRLAGDNILAGLLTATTDNRTDQTGTWHTQPLAFRRWRDALQRRNTVTAVHAVVGDSVTEGVYGNPIDKYRAALAHFNGGRVSVGWVNASQVGFIFKGWRFAALKQSDGTPATLGTYQGDPDYVTPPHVGPAGYSWSVKAGSLLRLQQIGGGGTYADATNVYTPSIDFHWSKQHAGAADLQFWLNVDSVLTLVHTVTGAEMNDASIAAGAYESGHKWTWQGRRQNVGAIEVRCVSPDGSHTAPAVFDGVYIDDADTVRVYNFGHSGWRHLGTYTVVNRGFTGSLNVAAPGSGFGTVTASGATFSNADVGGSVALAGVELGYITAITDSTHATLALSAFATNQTSVALTIAPYGGVTNNVGHRQFLAALQPDLITDAHGINDVYANDPSIVAATEAAYYAWATGYTRTFQATTVTTGARTLTAPAGTFTARDFGANVAGAGIPAGTQIVSVASDTVAVLSTTATGAATVTVTLTGPVPSFAFVFPYASYATGKTTIWPQVEPIARNQAAALGAGFISMYAALGSDTDASVNPGSTDPWFADGAHLSNDGGYVYADALASAVGVSTVDDRPTGTVKPFPLGTNQDWVWQLDEASPAVGNAPGLFLRYVGLGADTGNAAVGLYTVFGLGVIALGDHNPVTISGGLNLLTVNQQVRVPAAGLNIHDATLGDVYAELVASNPLAGTYASAGMLRLALAHGDLYIDSTSDVGYSGAFLGLTRHPGDAYPSLVAGHSFNIPYLGFGTGGRSMVASMVASPNLIAVGGQFTNDDIGLPVTGAGIPAGTVINSVSDANTAVLNNSATVTAVVVTVGGGPDAVLARRAAGIIAAGIGSLDQFAGGELRVLNTVSANYTVAYADRGKMVIQTAAGATTLTWPQDSDAAIAIGTRIAIANSGTGLVTHAAGTGATISGRAVLLPGEEQVATKTAANTWLLTGYNRDIQYLLGSSLGLDPLTVDVTTGRIVLTSSATSGLAGPIINLYTNDADSLPYLVLGHSFGTPYLGLGYGKRAFTSDTVSGSTVHSTDAAFTAGDVGAAVTGTNIPAGTRIQSRTDANNVVLTAAVTGTLVGAADLAIGAAAAAAISLAVISSTPYPAAGLTGNEVLVGGRASLVNAQVGTSYTVVATDRFKIITRSNASASTQTWPQDSDSTIPLGTIIEVVNIGAGTVTHAAGTGATVAGSALTQLGGTVAHACKVAANTWLITGSPVAASMTSAQLAAIMSDESGSGSLLFGTGPAMSSPAIAWGINARSGTAYTVVAGDVGSVITRTNTAASTQVWPKNATSAIAIGTIIEVRNLGTSLGAVTHSAESGATITGTTTQAIGTTLRALKTDTNAWHIN